MGTTDGRVVGITKILDNGPDAERCNIVLVAEGFTAAEQSDFDALCADFVTVLQAEPWFPIMGGTINVHRLNVESNQSGADDPRICGTDSEGDDTVVATYFDATFCGDGNHQLRRCLLGDVALVKAELDSRLPARHVGAVLVNTTKFGGCASGMNDGEPVFFSSVGSGWETVALHELGHAAFNLADEYAYLRAYDSDETDRDVYPDPEPMRQNITTQTNRAFLKWQNLLSPGVPAPTMVNPDCTKWDKHPNVLSDPDAIGLFEGAGTYHCRLFRPAYRCRMRTNTDPFCRVCLEAIAVDLSGFATADPVLEIEPMLLDFGEVAHRLTQFRSFEIRNVRSGHPVPLRVRLQPPLGGGFTYAPGTETDFLLPAPIFEPFTSRQVFVAFTSPLIGGPSFSGRIDIATVEAGQPLQQATLSLLAKAVPPRPVDTVLVIDRSGSMAEPTGVPGQGKIHHAIQAASLYISLLKDSDQIGLVRYNQASKASDVLLDMLVADAVGRQKAIGRLSEAELTPNGATSIGAGIIRGSTVLDDASADSRALVVLTDGRQNTAPDISAGRLVVEGKSPRQRVFAVGLGLNQLEDKLQEIADATNGVAQITGALVDQSEFLLQKLYVQILSDINDEAIVRDPRQHIEDFGTQTTPIWLSELDVSCDFIVLWRPSRLFPELLRITLEAPDGTVIDPAAAALLNNVEYVENTTHAFYRVHFPIRAGDPFAHVGRWQVRVELVRDSIEFVDLFYSVMAKARSDFRLAGHLTQADFRPHSPMIVRLEPTLFGLPVALDSPVTATVTLPTGAQRTVALASDSDGTYTGSFIDTAAVGPYGVDCEVSATSPAGHRVTRCRHLTGLIFRQPRR
ncbi:M64 family metallopeptidase [Streptosporangium canum]|uniref:M64 family metallopeptidase n=1 Tax=Streptosporangium canum TaxID=324952 RepID=UPI0034467256